MADTIHLLQNLTMLVALHVIVGFVDLRRRASQWVPMIQGMLFGAVMVLGMVRAVELQKGVIYDGRSVVAALCGLLFGPAAAVIACVMGCAWRVMVAGPGMLAGVLMIVVSGALGVVFHRSRQRERRMSFGFLLCFGYLVQAAMLAVLVTLPTSLAIEVVMRVFWVVLLAYPLTTAVMGQLIATQQARLSFVQGMHSKLESLQATFHCMGDGVIATNVEGHIEQIDDEAQRLTGWPEEKALGQPLAVVLRVRSMRSGVEVADPLNELLRHGRLVAPDDHAVLVSRVGSPIPITYRATVIHTPDGYLSGAVIVFRRESPEQKERREAEESAQHYRALIDSGEALAWTTGRDGLADFFNAAWQEFTGKTMAQQVGSRWYGGVYAADRESFRKAYEAAFEARDPFEQVVRLRRHDGTYGRVLMTAKPLCAADRSFLGYVGQGLDITGLLKGHEHHDVFFEQAPMGIAVFRTIRDASGMPIDYYLLEANPAFSRMLALRPAEEPGQPICQAIPEIESSWLELCQQVALTGAPGTLEGVIPLTDDAIRIVAFRPNPGELILTLVALSDQGTTAAEAASG